VTLYAPSLFGKREVDQVFLPTSRFSQRLG
jgi:hypothetical protein